MYNNFNVKRFMKTKLIKKKKHDSKKESDEEQITGESIVYANIGGVRETVIHESVYAPIPLKRLIDYFY